MTSSCSRLPSKTGCRFAGIVDSDILRLFELQKAPSLSSSEAEADQSSTPEASPKVDAQAEEEVRSKASSEENMNTQEMETLFSNNGHVLALDSR